MDLREVNTDYHWDGDVNYNNFFSPNICHVCKSTNNNNLILCNNCCMISYCNEGHRNQHYKQHQQFCAYITQYLRDNGGTQWRYRRSEMPEWIESRRKFLRVVTQQLPRSLQSYEMQMIIFAKSCHICHQQIDLYTCEICYSDNYCVNHTLDFINDHASKCQELRLCRGLNVSEYIRPMNLKKKFQLYPSKPANNMKEFVLNYVRRSEYSDCFIEDWRRCDYYYSDFISGPLTLYDGMKKTKLDLDIIGPQYVIHVVSANSIEKKHIKAWEFLQHHLCTIKRLTVVLIGQELQTQNINLESCCRCKVRKQKFNVMCRPGFYHEYTNDPTFQRPNVIIIFQAHFDTTSTWQEHSLLTPQRMNCPYILTAGSQSIAEENVNNVRKIININPIYNGPNNFKSFLPCRQLHTDCVGYRNSHVTVYRNLHPS